MPRCHSTLGSIAEFVGNTWGISGLRAGEEDEFFALAVACRGIASGQRPAQGLARTGRAVLAAIHGRSGVRVALLPSPIPRAAGRTVARAGTFGKARGSCKTPVFGYE